MDNVRAANHGRVIHLRAFKMGVRATGPAGNPPSCGYTPALRAFPFVPGVTVEGKRLMGQPISFFLSLGLGLSGINRVISRKGGKGGFEVPPVPFLFQRSYA